MEESMNADSFLSNTIKRVFKPKQVLSASAWMEQNIVLSTRSSALAGKYRFSHTPYWRFICDLIDNPRVRKIVIRKSAQVGASTLLANALLYYVCNKNFPILYTGVSNESVKSFSERDLIPRFNDCEAIKEFLPSNTDDFKKLEFAFKSCTVRLVGAGSAQALASRPIAIAIADEVDKYASLESFGEAPSLNLIEARTITFPNDKKIFVVSTPTVASTSVIESEYLKGSQHKFFITCKHCQAKQVLDFKNIQWPSDCKDKEGVYDLDRVEKIGRAHV